VPILAMTAPCGLRRRVSPKVVNVRQRMREIFLADTARN